jgi:hypothetical protein
MSYRQTLEMCLGQLIELLLKLGILRCELRFEVASFALQSTLEFANLQILVVSK